MEPKEIVKRGYELFGKGDMQTFFTEVVHDDITWIFPGDKHPMSGTHKGKEAMMKTMSLIPQLWDNFSVTPEFMIGEGNKVFVKCKATADGMDADFGHFFKVENEKITEFHIFDDSQKLASIMKAM